MDIRFPDDPEGLLPTRFGNAILAFESHSRKRWGLDSIPAWPRLELLLSEEDRRLQVDARGETAFFVNGALLAGLAGGILGLDAIVNQPTSSFWLWAYALPFIGAYVLYRWAVESAIRWGDAVRAVTDLHRLALYENMGVRRPATFSEERELIGPTVSAALLYGHPIPDELSAGADHDDQEKDA